MSDKVKTREELRSEIDKARRQGKKIVTTNGCFDVLHVGHVRYLQEAKQMGDILIVAINSDESVRAIKGDKRPLVPEDERAEILAALECVDYVMIFPELDPIQFLRELRPDIHVKGGDYAPDQVIERAQPAGIPPFLLEPLHAAETSRCLASCLPPIHARTYQLADLHFKVESHLLVHFPPDAVTIDECPQAHQPAA